MREDYKRQIKEILGGTQCPKDFQCYKSGFENLCKAKDIGLESLLECLEEEVPKGCKFSIHFGDSYFCHCPLRVYIAKKLKK